MLVDDHRDGVLARRSVLEELGYHVTPAHSGDEALTRLDEQSCDLLITDYKMAPMDGVELIRTVRERGLEIPIILLSGFAEYVGFSSDSTGADIVLQKSASEIVLLARHAKRLLIAKKKPVGSQKKTLARTKSQGRP